MFIFEFRNSGEMSRIAWKQPQSAFEIIWTSGMECSSPGEELYPAHCRQGSWFIPPSLRLHLPTGLRVSTDVSSKHLALCTPKVLSSCNLPVPQLLWFKSKLSPDCVMCSEVGLLGGDQVWNTVHLSVLIHDCARCAVRRWSLVRRGGSLEVGPMVNFCL